MPDHLKMRAHRNLIGRTLRDVSDATGIPQPTLSRIESGAVIPRRETARRLWRYYAGEVELGDIYDPLFHAQERTDEHPRPAPRRDP